MTQKFLVQLKLFLRLMRDRRVSPLLKLIPLITLLYFILPDPLPIAIDDIAVLFIGFFGFIFLCPKEIVAEHMAELQNSLSGNAKNPAGSGDVIDVSFRELDPKSDGKNQPPAGK